MKPVKEILKNIPKPAWWCAGILVVYSLSGFFGVPWLAERQLKGITDQRLGLITEVESIYFNPFTFYAQVDGLQVVDRDTGPLLELQTLRANVQPTRLVLLRVQFAELSVQSLQFYFERDQDGLDTVSRLAQIWSATATEPAAPPEPQPEEASEPFPVQLENISLTDINLSIRDEVPETPFETTLTLTDARIANLSTLPDSEGSNVLTFDFEDQARLSWRGELQLNPPLFTGELNLENFALGVVSRYLQDTLPLTLDSGRLNAGLAYRLDLSGEQLALALDQVQLSVSDLAAVQVGQPQPFLTAGLLQMSNGSVAIPGNRVELESLQLEQVALAVIREADAQINLQQMIAAMTGNAGAGPAAEADDQAGNGVPWELSLQRLVLADNRITLSDRSLETPGELGIQLNVETTDLSNQVEALFPLQVSVAFDSGGELQVQGEAGVLPAPVLNASASLVALDLTVLQPYIDEYAFVQLESALLEFQSELLVSSDEPFAYRGGVQLRELSVVDQRLQETLVTLAELAVTEVNFSLAGNSLDISELLFDSPYARVLIDEDGSTNVGQLAKQGGSSGSEAAATVDETTVEVTPDTDADTGASPLALTIGRIRVANGASDFTDLNLPIPFDADIRELAGTAEGFSAPSSQPIEFILEGNVDEYGLVQLDSSFNPFAITEQSRIDLQFRNLDLPPLTPYVIKFAGREIASGNMDVDLSYLMEAGQLTANNQVVLRDLSLGARVAHPDAMDLPLDLAMALLKDSRGVIDLEVPVSGDVNSPEFNLGPAIRRALTNVLTNLVTAPFRLLGRLVGGQEDDISNIKFQAGRATLAPPERQVLDQLRQALAQRPELVLELPLLATEADRQALQASLVTEKVTARIEELPDQGSSLTDRRLAALEALYLEAGLAPSPEELQAANYIETTVTNPLTGEPLSSRQPDVQAYVEDLRNRLTAAESVSDQRLGELAEARVTAISDFLLAGGELNAAQLETGEAQTGEPDDDGWLVLEFGLQAGSR